jgi:hypothetical protein
MKKQIAVLLSLIFSLSIVSMAQTKTVTNADLEKFRQKRLQAERNYRENYERMGFPSPAELERRNEEDRIQREALSEKLRKERLERESIEAQEERNRAPERQNQYVQNNPDQYYQTGGYYNNYLPYGYVTNSNNWFSRHRRFQFGGNQQVYPASGFFTVRELNRIYTGQPFRTNTPNIRIRTLRPTVKINIGGGRRH